MGKRRKKFGSIIFVYAFFCLPFVAAAQEDVSWLDELLDELLDDLSGFVPVIFHIEEETQENNLELILETKENETISPEIFSAEIVEEPISSEFANAIRSKQSGGLWHIPSTWEGDTVPGPDDTVIISANTVESTSSLIVGHMIVQEGAIYKIGNSSNFYANQVSVGVLENNGTINYSRKSTLEITERLDNQGAITVPIKWSGKQSGEFISNQRLFTDFLLGADISIDDDIEIDNFRSNGHAVHTLANPEIRIGMYDSISILGPSDIYVSPVVGYTRNYSGSISAPLGNLYLYGGNYSSNFEAETIYINERADYKIIRDSELRGKIIVGENANITYFHQYGFTQDLDIIGSIINNGKVTSNLIVTVRGDVINDGRWTPQRTYFRGPDGADSYMFHEGDITDSEEIRSLGLDGKTDNYSTLINSREQNIISFLGAGVDVGVEYFINIDSDDIRDPYDFDNTLYSSVIDDQIFGEPFTVKIRTSQDANQTIYLHSNVGQTSPNKINLRSGRWDGEVTVYGHGERARLFVNQGDYLGESNNFSIANTLVSDFGDVSGHVYDATLGGDPVYLANQTVSLYSHHPDEYLGDAQVAETATNGDGRYKFENIACGTYYISSGPQDSVYRDITRVDIPCGTKTYKDVGLVQCSPNGRVPVLILPGIMGSDRIGNSGIYPELTEKRPSWRGGEIEIHDIDNLATRFFGFDLGFYRLSDSLVGQGYVLGCDVFHVPYDWSLPVYESAEHYLKPWIEKAKVMSGQPQVDIVAHSMGGLVTRAYLQGPDYENDVRKFVMVGTPNYGSVDSYPAWAGGDPLSADYLRNELTEFADNFQTKTIDKNYQIRTGNGSLCGEQGEDLLQRSLENLLRLVSKTLGYCDNQKVYDFLHDQGQALGHLIPTYDNPLYQITLNSQIAGEGKDIIHEENKFLKQLNYQECFSKLCSYEDRVVRSILDVSENTDIKIFYGEESGPGTTLSRLKVFNYNGDLYKDGQYAIGGEARNGYGDGTVLVQSAKIPNISSQKYEDRSHTSLVREAIDDIINFINK